jgi:hypothetical protein
MRSSKNRGKHYLVCSNRHVSKDACIGSFISVDKLEQIVLEELKTLSSALLDQDELERNILLRDSTAAQKKRLTDDMTTYTKKIEELSRALRELYLDKVRGIISEDDFVALSAEFSRQKMLLDQQVVECNKKLAKIDERIAAGDNRRALIQQYTNPEHLTREMVDVLIDHITIGKRAKGEKAPPIEIHWNF